MKQFISGATIILAATLILTACSGRNYEINLVPTEGKIYRELKTFAKEKDETLKIDHFLKFYPKYTKNKEQKIILHTWSGLFNKNNMPGEFGGFGRFHSISNNMGSASLYIERYSGSDDIAGQLQESWKTIDILVDHMIGWLDTQIKQEKGYTKLRQFLDKTLRQDLKNLRVYIFHLQTSELIDENDSAEKFRNEIFARFSLYLIERGYFKMTDLPAMMKFVADLPQITEDKEMFIIKMDSMVRFLAGKMGLTDKEPLPEFLASLKNPENLEELGDSYLNYFKQTEYYKKQLKNSPELRESDPDVIPDKIMSRLIESIINPSLFLGLTGPDRIKVNIHNLPTATLSNGKRDKIKLTWEGPLDGENAGNERGLPAFSYAVWAQPNKIFQEKHFGEVTIEGENLLQYCLWHASLSKAEAKEWDEFTTKLKPSTFDKQFEEANFSEGLSERVVQLNEGVFDAFGD